MGIRAALLIMGCSCLKGATSCRTAVRNQGCLPPQSNLGAGALVLGGVPDVRRNQGSMVCVSCHSSRALPPGKRSVASVEAQTPAPLPEGPVQYDISEDAAGTNSQDNHITAYARGVVEGTEVSILMDSGASVSFFSTDFSMSVSALRTRPLRKKDKQ